MQSERNSSIRCCSRRRGGGLAAGAAAITFCLLTLASVCAQAHDPDDYNPSKSGRVMLNARGGVAFGLVNAERDLRYMGAAALDFGIGLDSRKNAYLILTPQLDVREGLYNVMVPLGFQYDIQLTRGLYLYPRASLGYGAFISNASVDFGPLRFSATDVTHGGVAIAELGIKYVVNGRFNIGFEPLSIPIFFTKDDYAVWYRLMFFLGVNL